MPEVLWNEQMNATLLEQIDAAGRRVIVRVEPLSKERVEDFTAYCLKHRRDVDESFLYDEDLETFSPNADNPTYILAGEGGKVVGAASLILDDYRRRARIGRFRIFHSEVEGLAAYRALMQEMMRHTQGLDRLQVFVPLVNTTLAEMVQGLGFSAERFSFILVRGDLDVPVVCFPDGYEVRPFVPGQDEEAWCEVRNAGFAKLRGSETPMTPSMVAEMVSSRNNVEGGMLILFHGDKPVGVVRGTADEYEGVPTMEIGPLALIPEYQGRGLGRNLLRTALKLARERGFRQTILCVNAENERAKSLYIKEGFKQVEGAACYGYPLHR